MLRVHPRSATSVFWGILLAPPKPLFGGEVVCTAPVPQSWESHSGVVFVSSCVFFCVNSIISHI